MCGILGVVSKSKMDYSVIDKMLDSLAHRGPDGRSYYQHNHVFLGHRRLAIIDLSTGDQPMYSDDNNMVIVYNGEIYNYKEIRERLIGAGHQFHTKSDTEVILKAYQVYGKDCLNLFNGIFTFAIYNIRNDTLFLARDHFGIKPLYYYHQNDIFIFASEQKAILEHPAVNRELNLAALHLHLNLRYTAGKNTLIKNIIRLPPAHFIELKNNMISVNRFWCLEPKAIQRSTELEIIEGLQHHLKQAVNRQLVSDVPIGVYLSGGLDSSTIVQKMSELGVEKINTYTLGFNEPTDEFKDAAQIANFFNTNHHEHTLDSNPLADYRKVIWHAEEPKINLIQGFQMSQYVSNHVKVILGGLGGDELLAGYDIHKFIYPFNKINQYTPRWLQRLFRWKADFIFKVQNSSRTLKWDEYRRGVQMLLAVGDIERFYLILRNSWDFDNAAYKNIYSKSFLNYQLDYSPKVVSEFTPYFDRVKDSSPLDQVLFTEFHTKMVDDYLLVEDRMSMANSVEERVPFLDRDLVQFGFSIPIAMKIKNNQTKYLFRKAMKGKLPPKIISKPKWGFTFNPYLQFKKDLKMEFEKVVTPEVIEQQGIFNYKYIKRILETSPHPKLRWHYNYLWIILGLVHFSDLFKIEIRMPK